MPRTKRQSRIKKTQVNFRISSGLKRIIGRDLITNDFIAILELVKNSFDARATHVDIVIEKGKMWIADNGKGMSPNDIRNKWLFVAYSAKADGTEDKKKDYRNRLSENVYAGNKGVGRFSCDRLGKNLRMQTRARGSSQTSVLDVNWDRFERSLKEEFIDIPARASTSRKLTQPTGVKKIKRGTILEIYPLREEWDRKKLLSLRAHLSKLVNPFDLSISYNRQKQFSISLRAPDEEKGDAKVLRRISATKDEEQAQALRLQIVNGSVSNFIFKELTEKTTYINCHLTPDGKAIETTLIDRGELIYKISEPNKYSALRDNVHVVLNLFYLNQSAKNTFARRMGISSARFGSIFLFRNGFRVLPIGEPGDDTFQIDRRKQQGYARYLGTRDVIGRIDVAGTEEYFREASSRDHGLIRTKAYEQLLEFFNNDCFLRLEAYITGVTWLDPLDKHSDSIRSLLKSNTRAKVIELVSALSNSRDVTLLDYSERLVGILSEKADDFEESLEDLRRIAEKTKNAALIRRIEKASERYKKLKEATKQAEAKAKEEAEARRRAEQNEAEARAETETETKRADQYQQAYEEEKKRSLFLTATSSLDRDAVVNLHHQIGIYAADIQMLLVHVFGKLKDHGKVDYDQISSVIENILFKNQKILTISRFATRANFRLDSELIEGDLAEYIATYIREFSQLYGGDGLDLSVIENKTSFTKKFIPMEISMLIDNLVNNADKAKASAIQFSFSTPLPKVFEMTISDNGRGLNKSIVEPERVFEKGFSTTNGSGLGLYHAKNIVERMKGSIQIDTGQQKGTKFIVRIPK